MFHWVIADVWESSHYNVIFNEMVYDYPSIHTTPKNVQGKQEYSKLTHNRFYIPVSLL